MYEVTVPGNAKRRYYTFGSQRIAVRTSSGTEYIHTDHLGSASLTTGTNGDEVAKQLYHPFGTVRYSSGSLATDYQYTGQYAHADLGLVTMHARYYHPYINRWISADTIVPDPANPQSYNRLSYVENNPLRFADPTGHMLWAGDGGQSAQSLAEHRAGLEHLLDPELVAYIEENVHKTTAGDWALWGVSFAGVVAAPTVIGAAASAPVSLSPAAAAMLKVRLYGAAGGLIGSALGYAFPSLFIFGTFDAREFAVATGVGAVTGFFPEAGGTGVLGGVARGAVANEAQYVLGNMWTEQEMEWGDALGAAALGGVTGGIGEAIGSKFFGYAREDIALYSARVAHGAPVFAQESLDVTVSTARGEAFIEGGRTFVLETISNIAGVLFPQASE
jgi:RHS repeat-associated protein